MRKIIKQIIDILLSLSFVVSIFFIIFEYLTHTNFIKNIYNIDYVDIFALSTFLFSLNLLLTYKKKLFNHWKKILFVLPIILVIGSMIIFMRRFDLFAMFEQEDHLVELLQLLFLIMNTIVSTILSKYYWQKNKFLSVIFAIVSLAFFVIAGEEISWGQRILKIATPEEYVALNTQGEINIHNNVSVFGYVYKAYALIGFIGSFAWTTKILLKKIFNNKIYNFLDILIPNWQYILYFLVAFLYNLDVHILNLRSGANTGNALWEEPMELLLFIGIGLFLIEKLLTRKNNA